MTTQNKSETIVSSDRKLKKVLRVGLYMIVNKYGKAQHEPVAITPLCEDVNLNQHGREINVNNLGLEEIESFKKLAKIRLHEFMNSERKAIRTIIKAWLDIRPITIDMNDPIYSSFMLGTNRKFSLT